MSVSCLESESMVYQSCATGQIRLGAGGNGWAAYVSEELLVEGVLVTTRPAISLARTRCTVMDTAIRHGTAVATY